MRVYQRRPSFLGVNLVKGLRVEIKRIFLIFRRIKCGVRTSMSLNFNPVLSSISPVKATAVSLTFSTIFSFPPYAREREKEKKTREKARI